MGLESGIRKKPIPDPGNAEEKNLGQFSKNYRTFYSKNCH